MFFNFIKIAFRNIRRHKLFSFINIFSLTLSLTVCIAALMIIKNQLSFDDFHPYPDRTYRVISELNYNDGRSTRWASTPFPLSERLNENYNFIESIVPFYSSLVGTGNAANKKLSIRGSYTSPGFFKVFGFELESGDPETALSNPSSIVLTKETARRFFGDKNPLGKTFSVENESDFTVTGVLEPLPNNTHLKFDVLGSINTVFTSDQIAIPKWDEYWNTNTYFLVKPGSKTEIIKKNLAALSDQVSSGFELREGISGYKFGLQSLNDIAAGEELQGDIGAGKTRSSLELLFFSAIAFVILLMACFNYTNLSIARALKRAKEVGMYKILGASRFSIISQFVIQAVLMSLAALILGYALLPFVPLLPDLTNELNTISPDLTLIIWFVLFAVFTGLLAGLIPAWILSKVEPVKMIKNFKNLNLIKGLSLRKTLVMGQFTLSLILIIFTLVVYQQTQFAGKSDYGFEDKNIINLALQGVDHKLLSNEISKVAGVSKVAATSRPFGTFASALANIKKEKSEPAINARTYSITPDLIENMELNVIAGGKILEEGQLKDFENKIVINEKLFSLLNLESPAAAIGERVWLDDSLEVEIAGVLEDFNFESLTQSLKPLALRFDSSRYEYLSIKAGSANLEDVASQIEMIWANIEPEQPIYYNYYDDFLYETHADTEIVASFGFYALIAITIACLGLLGMVTYTVEVRTQEVGIRKVLGADVVGIILLLSKEFIWLLALAAVIGLPVGYWIGLQFLSSYAYHISIGFSILTMGLGIMLLVGLLAIGTQTWKIAQSNPIDSIRSEG